MQAVAFLAFSALMLIQSTAPAKSIHVRRSGQIMLHGSIEKVFPLFGPVEEEKWAEGWEPSIKHGSNSEEGTVFTTADPHPATWVLDRFDAKSHTVRYVTVAPELRVVQIDIGCQAAGEAETRCEVTYTMTALSDLGETLVENYTQSHHDHRIQQWQTAIDHYLQTGTRMAHHE